MGTGEPNRKWHETIKNLDGYIFITQECSHSLSASLKNELDIAREE